MPASPADEYRRLVERLLKRAGARVDEPPSEPTWQAFLASTIDALASLGNDRYLLERSLEISSEEMASLYDDLRASSEQLRKEHGDLRQMQQPDGLAEPVGLLARDLQRLGLVGAGAARVAGLQVCQRQRRQRRRGVDGFIQFAAQGQADLEL